MKTVDRFSITITFDYLARLEPRLGKLRLEARALSRSTARDKGFCANAAWSGGGKAWQGRGFKKRMSELVGWYRRYDHAALAEWQAAEDRRLEEIERVNGSVTADDYEMGFPSSCLDPDHQFSILDTREAWDVAFRAIYDALPDCRNCWCG